MTDDAVLHVMQSFAFISPGYHEWRQKTLRQHMAQFAMDPKEAADKFRESWRKPLEAYSMEDIESVLEDMEHGRIDVPTYGEAARTIARHARALVNKRLADKRNAEWRNPPPPEGDTSPQLTPEEFREMRKSLGDMFRAVTWTSPEDYRKNSRAFQEALDRASREERKYKCNKTRETKR